MTANKIRKYATGRARASLACGECGRNGQGDGLIAREEKGRLRGIMGYSCSKRANGGCEGKHGPLLLTGIVGAWKRDHRPAM